MQRRHTLTQKKKAAIEEGFSQRKVEGLASYQADLAAWARQTFSVPLIPPKPVMSRLISQKETTFPIQQTNRGVAQRPCRKPLQPGSEQSMTLDNT